MKTKKIALLSFLACACLIGGAVGMNANSVSADEVVTPIVTMQAGGSLRVPMAEPVEGKDRDGLKFRAYFDLEQVMALEGEKSVGMFIAPADYYEAKEINADTCFGAGKVYCWGGATAGMTQIVHVDGYAYKHSEDATVLTMDASLWNLKTTSLDKEFVGVAYLKAGGKYYFAENLAKATPVSVAQQALLAGDVKAEDGVEGDTVEKATKRVEAAYITPYLGEGKPYTYTENVYKQQKNGEYTLATTAEKEVNVTSWNTEALAGEAPANYVKYDGKCSSMVMNLVGDNTKDVYFNYAGNRVVILDGDTKNTWDQTYMEKQGQPAALKNSEDVIYEGMSMKMAPNNNGWEGFVWKEGLNLPAPTNTISMVVKIGSLFVPEEIDEEGNVTEAYTVTALEKFQVHNGVSYATDYDVTDLKTNTKITTQDIKNDDGTIRLESGLYKIVVTFGKSISVIKEFTFKMTNTAEVTTEEGTKTIKQPIYWIDNICAENIKAVSVAEVPHIYKDTLTFPAPEVIDTTIWENETSDLTPVVKYKANNAGDYSTITAKDGVYTITPVEGAYRYEVVINGTEYIAVKGQHFVDFSLPVAERKAIAWNTYGDAYETADSSENALSATPYGSGLWAAPWRYACYKSLADKKPGWDNVVGFTPTKIGMWIYTASAVTITGKQIWFARNNAYGVAEETYTSTAGEYFYFELTTFSKTISNDYAIGFACPAGVYVIEIILIP